jgi:hypothetical protein
LRHLFSEVLPLSEADTLSLAASRTPRQTRNAHVPMVMLTQRVVQVGYSSLSSISVVRSGGRRIPSRSAVATASSLECDCSFVMMLCTWLRTV